MLMELYLLPSIPGRGASEVLPSLVSSLSCDALTGGKGTRFPLLCLEVELHPAWPFVILGSPLQSNGR